MAPHDKCGNCGHEKTSHFHANPDDKSCSRIFCGCKRFL